MVKHHSTNKTVNISKNKRQVLFDVQAEKSNLDKSPAKINKTANPSIKMCIERLLHLQVAEKAMFLFSYDWLPVAKNDDVFNKFYEGFYRRLIKKINSKHKFLSKKVKFFSTGDQSYEKKVV